MMFSFIGDNARYTFRLDLARPFDPRVFSKMADNISESVKLVVVFKNPAARLPNIVDFVLAMARAPH